MLVIISDISVNKVSTASSGSCHVLVSLVAL